jgi:SAM-dependent methyltransferase
MSKLIQPITPYSEFSKIYSQVMNHINYQRWVNFILDSLEDSPKNCLDLACGTGLLLKNFPSTLSKYGLDLSNEMLIEAKKNNPKAKFMNADISNFTLKKKFDLITCTHDSINYILEPKLLKKHFDLVFKHLSDKGTYIFDVSSEENILRNFDKKIIRDKVDNTYLIWDNVYNKKKKEIYSYLYFSDLEHSGTQDNLEIHKQRFYSTEELDRILKDVGFKILNIGEDYKSWKKTKRASLIVYQVMKS